MPARQATARLDVSETSVLGLKTLLPLMVGARAMPPVSLNWLKGAKRASSSWARACITFAREMATLGWLRSARARICLRSWRLAGRTAVPEGAGAPVAPAAGLAALG